MKTVYHGSQVSKAIRVELKKAFPSIKFSVKYKSYTGGNSVRVEWEMGPSEEQVKKIAEKYQQGTFDGMTDSYNYEATLVSLPSGEVAELGGVKYVFCNRSIPDNVHAVIREDICRKFGVEYVDYNTRIGHEYVDQTARKACYGIDLTGQHVTGSKIEHGRVVVAVGGF